MVHVNAVMLNMCKPGQLSLKCLPHSTGWTGCNFGQQSSANTRHRQCWTM